MNGYDEFLKAFREMPKGEDPVSYTVHCRLRAKMDRQGRCYELSLRSAIKAAEKKEMWDVVHGEILQLSFSNSEGFQTKMINHAWLEKGDLIYDAVGDRIYTREGYGYFTPNTHTRYSAKEAWLLAEKYRHWGPDWE